MARKEELEITIGADGEVSIHVSGAGGASCMKLTEDLEKALGVVLSREKTSEYYRENDGLSVNVEGENR
jgi:hypothetical protein